MKNNYIKNNNTLRDLKTYQGRKTLFYNKGKMTHAFIFDNKQYLGSIRVDGTFLPKKNYSKNLLLTTSYDRVKKTNKKK